jgi:hypothetical protein
MNCIRLTVGISLIVLAAVLQGCDGGTLLPITLTEGESIRYQMTTVEEMNMDLPMGMGATNTTETKEFMLTFAIVGVDAEGLASVEVTFDEASSSASGGGPMAALSECGALAVKGMAGKKLSFELTNDGDVSSVQGVYELQSAVSAAYSKALKEKLGDMPGMAAMTGPIKAQIEASLTTESMELMLQDILLLRPLEPVKAGGTWENTYTASGAMPHEAAEIYTLNALGTGEAEIGGQSVISPSAAGVTTPNGASLSFSGNGASSATIDESTGWLQKSQGKANLSGQINAAGTKMEMKLTVSTTVTRL